MQLIKILIFIGFAIFAALTMAHTAQANDANNEIPALFARSNLTAWCVVPFDAKKRGPEERAQMLEKLGFKNFAYDWRGKDIPAFDAEVDACKKHGINLAAWWFPTNPNDAVAKTILDVCRRHDIHPQLWVMGGGADTKTADEQTKRVDQEAERIGKIVELATPFGCRVELYNHNNWFGQTDNEIAIIERLKQKGITSVGMVYNFSHGHWDIADFAARWKRMQPYVVAVNVSGMVKSEKLIPPSQGDHELEMLRIIEQSGWTGPIGLIAEQGGDAETTLGNGIKGLTWLGKELARPGSGGERPRFDPPAVDPKSSPTTEIRLVPGRFGKALDASAGGLLLPGRSEWQTAPITVDAWALLHDSKKFNVVVASDSKASGEHWELYSSAGPGDFAVFLPGKGGDIRSGVKITDNAWHHLAMILEKDRVRMYVDAKLVKEKKIPPSDRPTVPGYLAIGRTVEDGIGCDGLVDDVRISRRAGDCRHSVGGDDAR